jgi:hypothetical protein
MTTTHEKAGDPDLREVLAGKGTNELSQDELGECGLYLLNRVTWAYNLSSGDFHVGHLVHRRIEGGFFLEWSTVRDAWDAHGRSGKFSQGTVHEQGSSRDNRTLFPLREALVRKLEIDDPDDLPDDRHIRRKLTGADAFEEFNKVLDKELPKLRQLVS